MLGRFKPKGVCSQEITYELENGIVRNVAFVAGCNGNLQGISRLVEGMPAEEVIRKLKGINCRGKGTSCPDQFAKALEQGLEHEEFFKQQNVREASKAANGQ